MRRRPEGRIGRRCKCLRRKGRARGGRFVQGMKDRPFSRRLVIRIGLVGRIAQPRAGKAQRGPRALPSEGYASAAAADRDARRSGLAEVESHRAQAKRAMKAESHDAALLSIVSDAGEGEVTRDASYRSGARSSCGKTRSYGFSFGSPAALENLITRTAGLAETDLRGLIGSDDGIAVVSPGFAYRAFDRHGC